LFLQAVNDGALCFGALLLAVFVQLSQYGFDVRTGLPQAALFATIMMLLNTAFEIYRRDTTASLAKNVGRALLALVMGIRVAYARCSRWFPTVRATATE